jgi:hypothetical protein
MTPLSVLFVWRSLVMHEVVHADPYAYPATPYRRPFLTPPCPTSSGGSGTQSSYNPFGPAGSGPTPEPPASSPPGDSFIRGPFQFQLGRYRHGWEQHARPRPRPRPRLTARARGTQYAILPSDSSRRCWFPHFLSPRFLAGREGGGIRRAGSTAVTVGSADTPARPRDRSFQRRKSDGHCGCRSTVQRLEAT